MRRHVVLDEEAVALDGCGDVGLVAAGVEVAMADLAIVIGADGVVALADVDQDVHIVRQALDRDVDRLHRGADVLVVGDREIRLVDLDVLAPRLSQKREVRVQQLAEIGHHPRQVMVVFVIRDGRQQMRPCHGDLDRLPRERRDRGELVDEAEIGRMIDGAAADRGRMEYVRIMPADAPGPIGAIKGGDLLPEVIQHRVGRRVAVVGPPMHLPAGDHVDARHLLFQDGGLHRPELRIRDIAGRELTQRHQPVERFIPARNAVGADDGGGIGRIKWHSALMLTELRANL